MTRTRRRRRADDGRAGPARRARHDEPAGAGASTGQRLERDIARPEASACCSTPAGGLPVEPEVRAAVEAAAQALRGRRRRSSSRSRRSSTRAHARRHGPLLAHARLARHRRRCRTSAARKVLPFIRALGRSAARRLSGAEVFHGYSQMGAMRDAAVAACRPYDFVLSPTRADRRLRRRAGRPDQRPEQPLEHIAFTLPTT